MRNIFRFALYFILGNEVTKQQNLGYCTRVGGTYSYEIMTIKGTSKAKIPILLLIKCGITIANIANNRITIINDNMSGHVWITFQQKATIEKMVNIKHLMGNCLFNEALTGLLLDKWYDTQYK